MSELYESIRRWVLELPGDAVVGMTCSSDLCLVAIFLGRSLKTDDFSYGGLPCDVIVLTMDFDLLHSGKNISVTAKEACELFLSKKFLTKENVVVE